MSGVAANLKVVFSADTNSYTASVKAAKAELGGFEQSATSAGKVARQQFADARGTVMVLGEEIGVHLPRHVQAFVAKLPGAASALSAAFSATAVIAIGVAVVDAGKKIYEFVKKNEEAAQKNAQAWREISGSMQLTNDDLQVTNDKLENAIAELEGKPHNSLKEAIDEAIQSADTLGSKLNADLQKISETLEIQQPGAFARFFGTHGTGDVTERARALQIQLAQIDIQGRDHLEALRRQGADQAEIDDATAALDSARQAAIDKERVGWAQPELEKARSQRPITGVGPTGQTFTPLTGGAQRIAALTAYVDSLGQASDFTGFSQTHGVLEGQQAKAQAAHDAAELAAKAAAAAYAAAMQGMTERIKLAVDSPMQVREYRKRVAKAQTEAVVEPVGGFHDVAGEMDQDLGRYGPRWRQYNDEIVTGRAEQAKLQLALSLTKTRIEEVTGAISPHAAALAEAKARASEYAIDLGVLGDQLKSFLTDQALTEPERETAAQKARNQSAALTGQNDVQAAQDAATIRATSTIGEFEDRLRETVQQFTHLGAALSNFTVRTLGDFNETLIKVLSTPENMLRGHHVWRHFGATTAESAGGTALRYGEGELMKGIGAIPGIGKLFGGAHKPMGTRSDPIYAVIASFGGGTFSSTNPGVFSGMGPMGTGIASMIGSMFGMGPAASTLSAAQAVTAASAGIATTSLDLGPILGFAGGGAIPSNMPAIVGELGPEIIEGAGGRRVIPNNQIGGPPQISIDARGANDPAAVNAAVHRAMASYLPHMSSMAVSALHDNNRRIPSSRVR